MSESHTIMDGQVHVYRRENSSFWQCAVYLSGRNHRQSAKQTNLAYAFEFARDWFMDRVAEDRLRRRGLMPAPAEVPVQALGPAKPRLPGEKTFREAAIALQREYEAMALDERQRNVGSRPYKDRQ